MKDFFLLLRSQPLLLVLLQVFNQINDLIISSAEKQKKVEAERQECRGKSQTNLSGGSTVLDYFKMIVKPEPCK